MRKIFSSVLALTVLALTPAYSADTTIPNQGQAVVQQVPSTQNASPVVGVAHPIDSGVPAFAREPDAPAAPNAAAITCPKELRNQVSIDDPHAKDWIVGGPDQTTPLKGARLFAGPPDEKTIERYNELTAIPFMNRDKGEFQQVWTFDEKLLQAGILLVCDYSGNNHFLMRAIPPGTKDCKELDPVDKNDISITTVVCQ
ncbi:MAG: hypothetical protein KBA75_04380 [Alphaproteobacteria bacterium]|nr:hypothetical protein [Alphaproteobacteria bacterium]